MPRRRLHAALLGLAGVLAASAAAAGVCDGAADRLPARAAEAAGGSGFARALGETPARERDARMLQELLAGNLPRFLRHAVPVTLQAAGAGDPAVTLCVLADYLAIGSDADHLHVPLSLPAALAVGRAFGFMLPTRRMVDAIYAQAAVRLAPQPLPAGPAMRTTAVLVQHEALVAQQRQQAAAPAGALTAGHKKDLVLSPRLWAWPDRLALYGWHRPGGVPIQPLSTVHGERYADYSHGVRLVARMAYVAGVPRPLKELLRDSRFAPLLSDEGPWPGPADEPPQALD